MRCNLAELPIVFRPVQVHPAPIDPGPGRHLRRRFRVPNEALMPKGPSWQQATVAAPRALARLRGRWDRFWSDTRPRKTGTGS